MQKLRRGAIISTFALATLLPSSTTMAAIPCHEQDVIPPPPNMVVPMIYIELPISPSSLLGRAQPVDRASAVPASESQAGAAQLSTVNLFRCLNYSTSDIVFGNSTPEFRVQTTARPEVESGVAYVDAESAHLVQYGDAYQLEDGRILIDYTAIIDEQTFFDGELVFIEKDDELYLDQAALRDETELGEQHEIQISERFTREVKIVEMTNGDSLTFDNQSEESMANIHITNANGETIFEGNSMAVGMVGGETQDIFVAHDLAPGDYTATVTFEGSDIKMNVIIHIAESNSTPEAATPAS